MIRLVFTMSTALSLLLFAGAASLWARGHWVGDFLWHNSGAGTSGAFCARGSVMFTLRTVSTFNPITPGVGPPPWEVFHESPPRDLLDVMDTMYGPTRYGRFAGFAWGLTREGGRVTSRDLVAPLWAMMLATAIAPTIAFVRRMAGRRRLHRLAVGLCPRCGYDLRASEARCPECSTPIASAATA